ncbi:MAG: hypothetical protein M1831_001130 [Alyxoria varia]|nr:MAG: hypothetical protein M1831_001130 [Alyxoria varia]
MPSATLPAPQPGSNPKDKPSTKSGITTTTEGERHIPSSVRPDGSVRKEIRVRPGYKPPEDVEVYKNRTAEAWKNRGKGGIPGAEFVEPEPKDAAETSRRKRRGGQGKGSKSAWDGEAGREKGAALNGDRKADGAEEGKAKKEEEPPDPEVLKEKEARKLSKKLRQARDLEKKKDDGNSLLPEQFEKVIKMNELMRQLENLGFDQEGNKKTRA